MRRDETLTRDVSGLARAWVIVFLRGIVALAFAVSAFFTAGMMRDMFGEVLGSVALIVGFAMYLLVADALSIWLAVVAFRERHWPLTLAHSVLLVALAGWFVVYSGVTLRMLVVFAAVHAVITGLAEAALAHCLHRHSAHRSLLTLVALVSWTLALWMALTGNARSATTLIAAYSALLGLTFILLSLGLRRLRPHVSEP